MKTFRVGELHDPWIGLFWRVRKEYPFKQLWLRIKWPWKARRYSINSDAIEYMNPRWTFMFSWVCDPLMHQYAETETMSAQKPSLDETTNHS